MEIQALGLIEVKGFLGAIAAADAALKTADVTLLNAEKISGGLTTIQLTGDVAAVKVAVDAGAAIAQELNSLRSAHVIPRLSVEAFKIIHEKDLKHETASPAKKEVKAKAVDKKDQEVEATEKNKNEESSKTKNTPSKKKLE